MTKGEEIVHRSIEEGGGSGKITTRESLLRAVHLDLTAEEKKQQNDRFSARKEFLIKVLKEFGFGFQSTVLVRCKRSVSSFDFSRETTITEVFSGTLKDFFDFQEKIRKQMQESGKKAKASFGFLKIERNPNQDLGQIPILKSPEEVHDFLKKIREVMDGLDLYGGKILLHEAYEVITPTTDKETPSEKPIKHDEVSEYFFEDLQRTYGELVLIPSSHLSWFSNFRTELVAVWDPDIDLTQDRSLSREQEEEKRLDLDVQILFDHLDFKRVSQVIGAAEPGDLRGYIIEAFPVVFKTIPNFNDKLMKALPDDFVLGEDSKKQLREVLKQIFYS